MAKHYLGIDVGGTNLVAGVVDEDYALIYKSELPTDNKRTFGEVVRDIVKVAKAALAGAGLSETDIDRVGLGVPGAVNPHNKHVILAPNLRWKDADVIGEFRKSWDINVEIANDADCAGVAEALAGAGVGYDNIIMLTLGTGVGGSVILDKRLFLGADGFGVEIGHMALVHGGARCACGLYGCFEAYASVTALRRQSIDAMFTVRQSLMWEECGHDLNRVNGRTAFDAARGGDETGRKVVDAYISYIAKGIASLTTVLRPDVFMIGGGISNEGEYLLEPIRKLVSVGYYAPDVLPAPAIVKAKLGNDAGIIGAALLGTQI